VEESADRRVNGVVDEDANGGSGQETILAASECDGDVLPLAVRDRCCVTTGTLSLYPQWEPMPDWAAPLQSRPPHAVPFFSATRLATLPK
jgi:hypothetical protein